MEWTMIAGLLVKYGPEVVDFIVRKVQSRGAVTLEEWQELRTLAEKTPESQLRDAIARVGLTQDNPHVANLFALLPPRGVPPVTGE